MLDLSYALPKASIEALVPDADTRVLATTVRDWKRAKPAQVPTLSLFVWDEMVHRGRARHPFKIAPYARDHGHKGGIYSFVQAELGTAPASSAFTVEMSRPGEAETFVDLSLVRCFPNDIHICDVEFADHSKPIGRGDETYPYRDYAGLHVFPEFLKRLIEVASSQGVSRISLMAAHPPLRTTFERHGFEVSDTEMAQRAALVGHGFPMILRL